VAKQVKQPLPTVNYAEADSQADQDYDGTSDKEPLYHNNHRALTQLLGRFRGPGSFGHNILIYSGQAFAMLLHPGLFLGPSSFSSFLFGLAGKPVLV